MLTHAGRQEILGFLHSHSMATIATVNAHGNPESALIAFAELPDFGIIFETFVDTRKFDNLKQNSQVALVIGWDTKNHITLQYEGVAEPIPANETDKYRKIFLEKDTPCTETFLLDPRVRLYRVEPTWLRYSDYTTDKPVVTEIDFSL